ncbi:hypothetical protein NEMBOFW57_009293 [Staphylotrichum longicolle]|uniref:Uncharacterized protein n=1 Tax=Staphylotrichum longicolle TaxID=669026 RepID=A0AAD4ENV3_9PEZI|nr:hypothetical protein NEMBOFW57_009293 [Staphylotrichum longicolle]
MVLQGLNHIPLKPFLEDYLAQHPIYFTSVAQIKEYLSIKRSEIIFLKQQQSKMGQIELHYSEGLFSAFNKLLGATPASSHEALEELAQLKQMRVVAGHVGNALPEIISRAEKTHEELKSRLVQSVKI